MRRYGRHNKVGRLVCQGGGDDGGNDKKVRGNILRIPPPSCVHCVVISDNNMIGIGIITIIGIGGVRGIQKGGQYLPLQVTIPGGVQKVVSGGGVKGVFYYKKEEDEC